MSFSMHDGGEDSPVSDINVTPLVDVMLVLLIVFMITMPVLTHSIQINLPTASETAKDEEEQKPKEPMWLAVDDKGQYYIDRSTTPHAERAACGRLFRRRCQKPRRHLGCRRIQRCRLRHSHPSPRHRQRSQNQKNRFQHRSQKYQRRTINRLTSGRLKTIFQTASFIFCP